VTRELPLIPNVKLFEFEKTTVPEVAVCVPAAIALGAVDCEADAVAVMVLPFIPNETLFEFEKTTVPELADEPAALIALGAVDWVALKLAVT
jgi:hypothetical protein